jgi:hypothetical protein
VEHMSEFFGTLSGLLLLIAGIPYVIDILKGRTHPHRGSFLIWSVLGAIAFSSQLAEGAVWSLVLPAADTLVTLIVFGLSIKYGVGGLNRRDITALIIAGLALVAWYYTRQPLVALLITIGIDAIGTLLTLHKTYLRPHTETLSAWTLAALGGVAAGLAVEDISFALLVYPLYTVLANGSIAAIIWLRAGKPRKARDES